jgi:hypothetical protein|tara:strand:- start:253 stop:474 length:222 start_codon:yes stop_codon:yes gene_type:complete
MNNEGVLNLAPDTIPISVVIKPFVVGASFFLPCIDTTEAKKQAHNLFKKRNITIKTAVVIENERYGVRIWRIL